jgi:membrane-bound lytic murein transglycosylase MltF
MCRNGIEKRERALDMFNNILSRLLALCVVLFVVSACDDATEKQAEAEKKKLSETQKPDAAKAAESLIAHANEPWKGDFSGMVERGMVRVLLPFSKTFFFVDKGQKKGINYEFLTRLEKHLNKQKPKKNGNKPSRIKVVMIPTPRKELLTRLLEGRGDFVAGNLTITQQRLGKVDFSDPWLTDVKEYVVTPASTPELTSADDLSGKTVHVRESSSYWESLEALNKRFKEEGKKPIKIVKANELLEDEDLLEMVNADALPAIIVDSHKARFWSKVFDNIRVHENAPVRSGGEIAWAFRKNSPELSAQLNGYIKSIKFGTKLGSSIFAAYLKQQGWLKKLNNEADRKKFLELVELLQKYGKQYDINWLILAAKAYQESRFDHTVKGPTGAVGVMQIKPSTARGPEVNIPDVTGLEDNIHAGTKYVRFLMDRYYKDLSNDPFNQTLIAFAGYNAGPERIAKLRKKARERGLDDTKWFNNVEWVVAESVGSVTVNYVRNIFQYFIIYSNVYDRQQQLEKLKSQ